MSLEGIFANIQRAVGARLRDLRIAKGNSQEQFAQEIGVSVQAVRNWESGRHQPTSYHLQQIANFYGITLQEFIAQIPGVAQGSGEYTVSIAVTGYLLSGEEEHPASAQSRTVSIPEGVRQEHPKAFGLVVRGDSLATHGINDGDIVLVDPESESVSGGIDVLMRDGLLFAHPVESEQEARVPDASSENTQRMGRTVWHLRRL